MVNVEEQAYNQFIAALKFLDEKMGYGGKTTIAIGSGLTLGYISQLLKPGSKKRPELKAQEAIATACGYKYDEFLALGRKLLANDNPDPHEKDSGINKTETHDAKVGTGMVRNDDEILHHYREELAALREELKWLRAETKELRDELKQFRKADEPAEKKTAV